MRWMQVAIRPAKPLAFGLLADTGTPVFGLPGNPVSAMVSFELFVRPALRLLAGHRTLHRLVVQATTSVDLNRTLDGKLHLLRAQATLDDMEWYVRTNQGQESHQLHSMAAANALVLLPDGSGVRAGEPVGVMLIDPDLGQYAAPKRPPGTPPSVTPTCSSISGVGRRIGTAAPPQKQHRPDDACRRAIGGPLWPRARRSAYFRHRPVQPPLRLLHAR